MVFRPEEIDNFLTIFEERKEKIRHFEGCNHLELLNDINNSHIFFTYSYWEAEHDLESYRNSPLFAETWKLTKALFAQKAEAWSVHQRVVLS